MLTATIYNFYKQSNKIILAPAPPPPPPGPAQQVAENLPPAQDGRGDLLAAIRNANKNNLKSVEERKRDKKEERKKEKEG